ncbi:hypothetical protein ABT160_24340 [Streptomyces sp. NPDC001941]|uniref:hypothetical protein n=1 Tax=Streptomyces sp. NPDC001941 TaxID=3154659 RepID=UPI00332C2505
MEANAKMRQALVKGKGDKAAAREKASASGLGADKGRTKSPTGGGGSRGGGGGGSRGGSGTGPGGSRPGGGNRPGGSANHTKTPGKGPERGTGGQGGGGGRNTPSAPGKGPQNGSSGLGRGGGKLPAGHGSSGNNGAPGKPLPHTRGERLGARQAARQERRAARQQAGLADRSADRAQRRGQRQTQWDKRQSDRSDRDAHKQQQRQQRAAERKKAKETKSATAAASGRVTLGEALAREAERRWDRRRAEQLAKNPPPKNSNTKTMPLAGPAATKPGAGTWKNAKPLSGKTPVNSTKNVKNPPPAATGTAGTAAPAKPHPAPHPGATPSAGPPRTPAPAKAPPPPAKAPPAAAKPGPTPAKPTDGWKNKAAFTKAKAAQDLADALAHKLAPKPAPDPVTKDTGKSTTSAGAAARSAAEQQALNQQWLIDALRAHEAAWNVFGEPPRTARTARTKAKGKRPHRDTGAAQATQAAGDTRGTQKAGEQQDPDAAGWFDAWLDHLRDLREERRERSRARHARFSAAPADAAEPRQWADIPDHHARPPRRAQTTQDIVDAVLIEDTENTGGPAASTPGPCGYPRRPQTPTKEAPMGADVHTASPQAGMTAQHRTNVTFDEYLVDITNIALAAGLDKDRAAELAVALGKVATALREIAGDLIGDHNISPKVVDRVTDLADSAARMRQSAERCATECEIASQAAQLAALSVARVYGEDLQAMDDAGLAQASSAAHHD